MKRFGVTAVVLATLVMLPLNARAQRGEGRGPGGPGMFGDKLSLLSQKSVQEELKLSEDEIKQATELSDKRRESFRDTQNLSREDRRQRFEEASKANDEAVAKILKPEQLARLTQISLQQRGPSALADAEVATALNLTSEQKDKVKAIQESARSEMRSLFESGNREQGREKFQALRKASDEKLQAVLTSDQQAKWKDLLGAPFAGEIRRPERRGGDRPRKNT